jgi:hypothetical protein
MSVLAMPSAVGSVFRWCSASEWLATLFSLTRAGEALAALYPNRMMTRILGYSAGVRFHHSEGSQRSEVTRMGLETGLL